MKKNFWRYFVIYPYFFAIIPLLNLYVANTDLVKFLDVLQYLVGIWVVVFFVHLIARKLLKTHTAAGLVTTILSVTIFWYGAFHESLETMEFFKTGIQSQFLLPIWLIGLGAIIFWVGLKRPDAPSLDRYLNFLSVILIVISLYPAIIQLEFKFSGLPDLTTKQTADPSTNNTPNKNASLKPQIEPDTLPDVYYIILDAHPRSDVLKEYYGFDNSEFINALESRGFYVATEAHSNYPHTAMSLPSSLNMNYLDELGVLDEGLSRQERIARSGALWGQSSVFKYFQSLGYTIKTRSFKYFEGNEFLPQFVNTTIGKVLFPSFPMWLHWNDLLNTMEELKDIPDIDAPTFTYAHILAPHPPFVFDRTGNFTGVTGYYRGDDGNLWKPHNNQFQDQLYYIEQRAVDIVDTIFNKSDSPPIIILQSDHGTFSTGMKARETLPILNAYYLPQEGKQFLYPSITPVNSFRLIANIYFGANFELLNDESFITFELFGYESLCKADFIFPENTEPEVWLKHAAKVLKSRQYHLSMADCELEAFITKKDTTLKLEKLKNGEYFRKVGSPQTLQLPLSQRTTEDYIFRANVLYAPQVTPADMKVSLLVNEEVLDEAYLRSGRQTISFEIPKEILTTNDSFVRVTLKNSSSQQLSEKDLRLVYFWIEWKPFSVYLPELVNTKQAGPDNLPLITLNPALQNTGIDPQLKTSPDWGIGIFNNASLLWLGHGQQEGLGGTLWATEQQTVQLQAQVQPGPGREDSLRHVQLDMTNATGTQTIQETFDTPTTLNFDVELQPGRNDFSFYVLDEATIIKQANGDTRPLLVKLDQVTIGPVEHQTGVEMVSTTENSLLAISPALSSLEVDSQLQTAPGWGIETFEKKSWLWLGHGQQEGLSGTLKATETQTVQIQAQVQPGPGREDSLRHVQLDMTNATGTQTIQETFDTPTTLNFDVELQPGRNDFSFYVLDEATILEQPNRDTRPLLVRLDKITVTSSTPFQAVIHPLIDIDEPASNTISLLAEPTTPPWAVEQNEKGSWLWLGHGQHEGFGGTLKATEPQTVQLQAHVQPGPSRADSLRHVQLEITNATGTQLVKKIFDTPTTLNFNVELQPGRNDFSFYVLDEATILKQANGDTRPLLVRLNQIFIAETDAVP